MSNPIPAGHGGKRKGSGRKPKAASPDQPTTAIDYNQARARREEALASLAEIELQVKRGELIPADQVEKCWTENASILRSTLLALPSRIAGGVAGAATTQEISAMAMSIIREVLTDLAARGERGMGEAEARRK